MFYIYVRLINNEFFDSLSTMHAFGEDIIVLLILKPALILLAVQTCLGLKAGIFILVQ